MGVFSKCSNSQIMYGSDCINHLANLSFARSKRSSRKDCLTFPIFTNSHQILWLPANQVRDRHEIKTANKTSCCHCLLPRRHPNQLRWGSAPPPWLAVMQGGGVVGVGGGPCCLHPAPCRLSGLATTTLFTKEIFHVPSSNDYGFQLRTYSKKRCLNSLAFIFSCLLIFRHKPVARWSTLTKPCGRKSNYSN